MYAFGPADLGLWRQLGAARAQHKGTLMSIALHMQLDEMPTACWDLLCNLGFVGGKAQRHNGTKAQGFDCIVGRMHGWTKESADMIR